MGVNLFVRKTFSAKDLKKQLNKTFNPKIKVLKTDKTLGNTIAKEWGTAVTRFVPRSICKTGGHLQDFVVSDSRVIWRRPARNNEPLYNITIGDEIANRLYEGPIKGKFRVRESGSTSYGPHEPQPHWDDCVRPGTDDWNEFVVRITPTIKEWMKNNG
jgi:hypothetical protein